MIDKESNTNQINLQQKRQDAINKYPGVWESVVEEWSQEDSGNFAWLTYAANYLLLTNGIHWAIDPFSMSTRITGIPKPDFVNDLQKLELVVLTHSHSDHLDLELIHAIAHLPIQWVVPEDMVEILQEKTSLSQSKMLIPIPGEIINFRGFSLLPFDSLHFHKHGGVKETGYLVSFSDQSWLFPGDIRNFDTSLLPNFGKVNGIFAHLWLGKGNALDPNPLLLSDFCRFFSSFTPERIVISHLNEYGRDETELWNNDHFAIVKKCFNEVSPQISIEMALMGSRVSLS